MKRLLLIKGLSYSTRMFSVRKGDTFEVEEDMAEMLLRTGRFQEMPVPAEPELPTEAVASEIGQPGIFSNMTKTELETFAAANGVDLMGCKTKAEMLAKLVAFAGARPEAELDFGSPTMEELQE